jgi:hypothetical protein
MCVAETSSLCLGQSRWGTEVLSISLWAWFTAAIVVALAAWQAAAKNRRARERAVAALFSEARTLITDAREETRQAASYPRLIGTWQGLPVQLTPVIDTLAVRRLPALWLQVTLQSPLPVEAHFDMMMRPAGPTTFSNFDLLRHGIGLPMGFPEHAALRTDDPTRVLDPSVIRPHLALFAIPQAKELLITQNGIRVVWLVAEADRARYGVLRQAEFGDAVMSAQDLEAILTTLVAIRVDILQHG